jgi:uncharacterized short protein YbdD (DUF466 family)
MSSTGEQLRRIWAWLRAVSGDSAYETYLERGPRSSGPLLTREQFYLDALRRRFCRVSRCC